MIIYNILFGELLIGLFVGDNLINVFLNIVILFLISIVVKIDVIICVKFVFE